MRHLWLSMFASDKDYTPIFIELRKLNDLTSIDLKSFIRVSISRKKELDDDLFSYFCNNGRFCFILDGFDEIIQSQRDVIQKQILQLSSDYPGCRFVVSSRYERRFAGWQNFDLYESQPFNLSKVKKLVELVPFDAAAKKLFLKQLDDDFYVQNRSFLSNPLLAIMMMMTFKENMDIPRRMNIFYDQAFTTLFQWHDATKAFNREKALDIDEFQRSFGMFCLLSYHQEKYEFTKSEVIDLINKSSKLCGINTKSEDILKDYEETVNLLKQEGLKYIFIHRSFQEYFCAYAMMRINPSKFADIFSAIRKRYDDNVLLMCFEMNKGIVIDQYVRPLFEKLKAAGTLTAPSGDKFGYLGRAGVRYTVHIGTSTGGDRSMLGLSYSMDESVEELLNNINSLMGFKVSGLHYTGSVMYGHEMFSHFDDVARTVRKDCGVLCDIVFVDSDCLVDVTLQSSAGGKDVVSFRPMLDRISNTISKKPEIFIPIEKRLAKEIDKLRKWCAAEIEESGKRDRSLDSILGL